MSTPTFVEDSNAIALAPLLASTIDNLKDSSNKYDYIMAFFIAIMAEGGYRLDCLYNPFTKKWSKEMTTIPQGWKLGVNCPYEVDFLYHRKSDIGIRLIGIPVGDYMVLNLISKQGYGNIKTRSIAINVVKHVNMHNKELGKFWNLKELALKFKDNLLTPLHADIMMAIGIAAPSLMGIPEEIKENINKMLDKDSRKNLEISCKLKKN